MYAPLWDLAGVYSPLVAGWPICALSDLAGRCVALGQLANVCCPIGSGRCLPPSSSWLAELLIFGHWLVVAES